VIAPLAELDLEALGDYIARDNPHGALSFIAQLREQCERIARHPQGCRRRPGARAALPKRARQ
jgi:toxin ParE1/3/4